MATRSLFVMNRLRALVAFACAACTHSRATPRPGTQPAATATLSYIGESGIGFACLPRAGDSTHFAVDVVVDSVRAERKSAFSLLRGMRAPVRPGYVNQAVTVEIQRAGQTRVIGTSCWHDAGIVVRGTHVALTDARIALDAPGSVVVRVMDGSGRALADSVLSAQQGESRRIAWRTR